MAQVQPVFDSIMTGTGSVNAELWVDLGLIPNGKQILLGYATYTAEDKNLQFETRSNLSTKSTATVVDTTLLDWTSTTAGGSVDRDFYQYGNIATTTVMSTGVEHLWLRIRSQSQAAGVYDYIVRYTLQ